MQRQTGATRSRGRNVRAVLEDVDSLEEVDVEYDGGMDGARLTDDEVFDALSNSLRSELLSYLQKQDGASTVSDIAEYLAAKENDTTVQQLSSYERKRVYIGLYQNHLPKLDDLGVVDYDKNRGTVRLRECVSQLEPYLQDVDNTSRSRKKIVASVAVAGVVFVGLLNIGALATVPDILWTALGIAGLFGIAALEAKGDL